MHLKSWFSLAFATIAIASPTVGHISKLHSRAVQDTPTIRAAVDSITTAINSLHSSIKLITAENTATSIKDLNQKAHVLGASLETGAHSISQSVPLRGIQDALGLLTPLRIAVTALNDTYTDLYAKMDIIKNSKQTELVVDALKSLKPGLVTLPGAIMTQIPTNMVASVTASLTIPSEAQLGAIIDNLIATIASEMEARAPGALPMPPAVRVDSGTRIHGRSWGQRRAMSTSHVAEEIAV